MRRRLAGTALLFAVALGCSSPPGRRMLEDAFVVFTGPLQVPAMAFRDAARFNPNTAATAVLFPINFPLHVVEHSAFWLVHLFDMPLAPYHYAVDSEPMDIYSTPAFPMELDKTAREALGSGVAIGALVVGTVVVAVVLTTLLY